MKTIITGAAGFIGYHLAKKLSKEGKKLILIDNFQRGKLDNSFKKLIDLPTNQFLQLDLTESKALSAINDDIGELYHLAAISGTENFYNIPDFGKIFRIFIYNQIFFTGVRNVYKFFGIASKENIKVSEAEFSAMITYEK